MSMFGFLTPPPRWRIPVLFLIGFIAGIGGFIFYTSKAVYYLSDDPRACINCHIMIPQYTTWTHSSHRTHATCNDCHVPHDYLWRKYFFKAKDGSRHATLFSLRLEPQVIQIKKEGMEVVQENCLRCHSSLNSRVWYHAEQKGERPNCWQCHREVPHGKVRSLSAVPNAGMQLPEEPQRVAPWIQKISKPAAH